MKKHILKSLSRLLMASLLLISWGAFADSATSDYQPSVLRGAELYNQNCGRCHNPRPAEHYSAREWSVIMPHMRVKAHMTKHETLDVEAFLGSTLTLEKQEIAGTKESTPVSAERGEALIGQLGCQGCHVINGQGGQMGPGLDQVYVNKGASFIYKKISNPSFNNSSSAMPKYPLNDSDINSIVQYLKAINQ